MLELITQSSEGAETLSNKIKFNQIMKGNKVRMTYVKTKSITSVMDLSMDIPKGLSSISCITFFIVIPLHSNKWDYCIALC